MKKALQIFAILAGIFTVSLVSYGIYLYISINDTAKEIHEPLEREQSTKRNVKVDVEKQEPLSFLIAGVDTTGDEHSGRSDTIIVMTVNPEKESITMLSIPRDTRTEIVGKDMDDKINHAYAFGGVQMTIDTVEQLLDIPIDHYVSINMEGFKGIVDALGGVTVTNETLEFTQDGHHFPIGELRLNGEEALSYSRMRYEDPRGDLGRNERQRQIVTAVIHEGATIGSITKVGSILEAVGDSVKTDLTLDEMWKVQSNYRQARHQVEQLELTGEGTKIDGIYYIQISQEELHRVQEELQSHLEL